MKTTVGELMESLNRFNPEDPIEIALRQYNKVHPVAYMDLESEEWSNIKYFASKNDGIHVRLTCHLPYDEKTFTITQKRKK